MIYTNIFNEISHDYIKNVNLFVRIRDPFHEFYFFLCMSQRQKRIIDNKKSRYHLHTHEKSSINLKYFTFTLNGIEQNTC